MTENTIAHAPARDPRTAPRRAERVFRPDVDLVDGTDEITLIADAPGLSRDRIEITCEAGVLTLHGRVDADARLAGREHARILVDEYDVGDWRRAFRLSDEVDLERIRAEYRDGVLSVHLPKVEARKPRRIQIAAG